MEDVPAAVPAHDSFFQAIANALNHRDKTDIHTVQSLRNDCYAYALSKKDEHSWVYQRPVENGIYPPINRTAYLERIKKDLPGHENREGKILCEKHNFVLQVHWYQNGEPTYLTDNIVKEGADPARPDINKRICINCNKDESSDIRVFSAAPAPIKLQSTALPTMTGMGSDNFGDGVNLNPGGSGFSDSDSDQEEEENAEEEEEIPIDDTNVLLPIDPSERSKSRVIANHDQYRSELIQRQRWAISSDDPKQAKRDKQYVDGSAASYLNFLNAERKASYAPAGAVISVAYRQKDVEHYKVEFHPSFTAPPDTKKDVHFNMRRTQIFNPIKYAKELGEERQRLAQAQGRDEEQTQRLNKKLLQFEAFMTDCAEQTKQNEKAEKYYDYNLYEYEDGQFEYETVPDGSFTARQIFVAAAFLFFSNLLFWSMWYQGAATFYQSLIEEKMDLAEAIYCTFSAVYGKIRLLRVLGGDVWTLVANSTFNFLSAPISHALSGLLWLLRGQWAYEDLIKLLGFGVIAGPVGGFFAFLTPNATQGLITAITHKNLTHTPPFDTILEISINPFIGNMSMYGSFLLNVMGTPGAFDFTQAIQSAVIARQLWVSRAGPTEMIVFGVGLAAFASFGWLGMGKNFQLIGTTNFNHYLGIGNAAPVLAMVPSAFIMMLFFTTSQTLVWNYGPMIRDIITRKFDWQSLNERNKNEFYLPVQIFLNGVSFIVTLGFTTTGALTTLWQQKISGQTVTPFVRVAGVAVATTIEWGVMNAVSTGMVETSAMYVAGTVRNAHYDFAERKKLPALSDDPEDDIEKPVEEFKRWMENKTREQARNASTVRQRRGAYVEAPLTAVVINGTQPTTDTTDKKSSAQAYRCCSWFRRRRQLVREDNEMLSLETGGLTINNNNNNHGGDKTPLLATEPPRAKPFFGCGIQ